MKIILYTLLLLPIMVIGQTQSENYVKSTVFTVPTQDGINATDGSGAITPSKKKTNINYFDGLGRSIQQIAYKQSEMGNDIVTHIEYDGFGRQSKDFLPYVHSSQSQNYKTDASSTQLTFYNTVAYENTINPFSENKYDQSPLNRILNQAAPGNAWIMGSGKEIKFDYNSNSISDEVVKFKVERYFTSNGVYENKLKHQGLYVAGSLYKTVTKDENWTSGKNHTTEEYKDNRDRIVLKRSYEGEVAHNTYYIYDDMNNLCFVVPPQFNTADCEKIVATQYNVPNSMATILMSQSPFNGAGGGSMVVNVSNNVLSANLSAGFTPLFLENYSFTINNPKIYNIVLGNVGIVGSTEYKAYIENGYLKFSRVSGSDPIIAVSLSTTINLSTLTYPEAIVNPDLLNDLCYQYKYDRSGRLKEKKIPSKQWEFIVYDKLDRVVATGPANSPFTNITNSGWLITKYDVFNRPVITGWMASPDAINSEARYTLQNENDLHATMYTSETKIQSSATITVNGITVKYNNYSWPSSTSRYHILTIQYYDSYDFGAPTEWIPASLPTLSLNDPVYYNFTIKPKGLSTASWVRILERTIDYRCERSYVLYDKKSRPILNHKSNHLGGYTTVYSKYDFEGKLLQKQYDHRRLAGSTLLTINDYFTYTNQGRVENSIHKINNGNEELIASNEYDELGQLVSKRVGGAPTLKGLQKVDYSYNIRGWLKAINDVDNLLQGNTDPLNPKDLFAFKINYNTVENTLGNTITPLYNGNITETFWRTESDNVKRKYGYIYDGLNRLTEAVYQRPHPSNPLLDNISNAYNERLTYDKNGNIKWLKRNGYLDSTNENIYQIDDLEYKYSNNQLDAIVDHSNSYDGFHDGQNPNGDGSRDYHYDANGNMTKDWNKGINNITYNHLNLPTRINFQVNDGEKFIAYIYNAEGTKVSKHVQSHVGEQINSRTDYLEGFQYADDVLQFFPTSEGYVSVTNGNTFNYVYNYTDHLGNIRVSYSKDRNGQPKIIEEHHYYPFGMKHSYNNEIREWGGSVETGGIYAILRPVRRGKYQYKYNGKEYQDEMGLNFYDYGARNYDPVIGRWMNIDPLAEISRRWSPYNYCMNNPVYFIDPDGMSAIDNDDVVFLDSKGVEVSRIKDDTRNEIYVQNGEESCAGGDEEYICSPIYSKAEISMSYTGSMSSSRPKMSEGTLSVNATFEDGSSITLSTFTADSGPSGIGSMPNGEYTASEIRNTNEEGMVRNGIGFKVILTDNTENCRTDLRIHPDGEKYIGTAGCIGITENAINLKAFRATMRSTLSEQNIILTTNITANPNYSDCDSSGKKKSKGGAAGN